MQEPTKPTGQPANTGATIVDSPGGDGIGNDPIDMVNGDDSYTAALKPVSGMKAVLAEGARRIRTAFSKDNKSASR